MQVLRTFITLDIPFLVAALHDRACVTAILRSHYLAGSRLCTRMHATIPISSNKKVSSRFLSLRQLPRSHVIVAQLPVPTSQDTLPPCSLLLSKSSSNHRYVAYTFRVQYSRGVVHHLTSVMLHCLSSSSCGRGPPEITSTRSPGGHKPPI